MALCVVPWRKLILKIDGLLFRMKVGVSLLRRLQVHRLRAHLSTNRPDVVHAHLLTSDLVAAIATRSLRIPWLTTMHGDYEAIESDGFSSAARIGDFTVAVSKIGRSVGHIVCITDKQVEQLGRLLPGHAKSGRISKIYNGYAASVLGNLGDPPESLANIPPDAFVIGMVARGIREKGWEVLIQAFLELDLPNSRLVLVGDGEYLRSVRSGIQDARVVFAGQVVDPLRYIARFDVGCLPSCLSAESLPTVVIEYLYLCKPVIASNVGEVAAMLESGGTSAAGIVIEIDEVDAMVKQLKLALTRLFSDRELREGMKRNAATAYKKFDMARCLATYLCVYDSVQS